MKKMTLLMFTIPLFLMASCSSKSKNEMLLGEWKLQSEIDLETHTINNDVEPMYAIINKDYIILTDKKDMERNEEYRWNLKHDSLIVILDGDSTFIYLKELNEKKLVVDYDFFGKTRLIFEKND
ncbi:MAG: lipocalin family protein [Cyclonatronaceae bacterium]